MQYYKSLKSGTLNHRLYALVSLGTPVGLRTPSSGHEGSGTAGVLHYCQDQLNWILQAQQQTNKKNPSFCHYDMFCLPQLSNLYLSWQGNICICWENMIWLQSVWILSDRKQISTNSLLSYYKNFTICWGFFYDGVLWCFYGHE